MAIYDHCIVLYADNDCAGAPFQWRLAKLSNQSETKVS